MDIAAKGDAKPGPEGGPMLACELGALEMGTADNAANGETKPRLGGGGMTGWVLGTPVPRPTLLGAWEHSDRAPEPDVLLEGLGCSCAKAK